VLALDSPRWSTLGHAYGCASEDASAPSGWSADAGFHDYSEIPNVIVCLRGIEACPEPKAGQGYWDTLISSLCHQGTIYSASFAAVPHIIDIGITAARTQEIDDGFFLLPALIEQSRLEGQRPEVPEDILGGYVASLPRLHELAFSARRFAWDHSYTAIVASALAAAEGHLQLSKCFLECLDERTVTKFFESF